MSATLFIVQVLDHEAVTVDAQVERRTQRVQDAVTEGALFVDHAGTIRACTAAAGLPPKIFATHPRTSGRSTFPFATAAP